MGEMSDLVEFDADSDELLAQGEVLLESSRQLLADMDGALQRAGDAAMPAAAGSDPGEVRLDLTAAERQPAIDDAPA